jgi:hypothetical protein
MLLLPWYYPRKESLVISEGLQRQIPHQEDFVTIKLELQKVLPMDSRLVVMVPRTVHQFTIQELVVQV